MIEKNEMIQQQLSHRTIREFTDESIPEEVFEKLMEVARRTATSNGMQASSIICITDNEIKKEISKVCKQEYVARAPELLIFIVDLYRNSHIAKEKNSVEESAKDMDNFFSAFTDACITCQNIVNAAEAIHLGTVYLGSILNDSEKICEILQLPQLTFPVVGLGIGYPNQNPQLKPRMDMKYRVFENKYTIFDNYLEELKDYDEEMRTYYDLRDANKRVDSFSNQVVAKFNNANPKRQGILNIVKKMGFDFHINN
ncbi:NADPH-dependent oxidoreductase [Anaerosalibacter sp. Marseille-P3206]|uniref:NADPH-dependent oxidoreductase n=1 Tax=Anaerosalibacter sp. Marseille-P3206 TaxID=1871005 RepID=UPI00098554CC|nr:NADPH-dependent oxidoreductase [Anaerosalibacter sp. Marseille-P3206]